MTGRSTKHWCGLQPQQQPVLGTNVSFVAALSLFVPQRPRNSASTAAEAGADPMLAGPGSNTQPLYFSAAATLKLSDALGALPGLKVSRAGWQHRRQARHCQYRTAPVYKTSSDGVRLYPGRLHLMTCCKLVLFCASSETRHHTHISVANSSATSRRRSFLLAQPLEESRQAAQHVAAGCQPALPT